MRAEDETRSRVCIWPRPAGYGPEGVHVAAGQGGNLKAKLTGEGRGSCAPACSRAGGWRWTVANAVGIDQSSERAARTAVDVGGRLALSSYPVALAHGPVLPHGVARPAQSKILRDSPSGPLLRLRVAL